MSGCGGAKDLAQTVCDETTAPVLDPGRGRTKIGQLWAYARDDRPWGGTDPPGVVYIYAPDRKAERPITPPISRQENAWASRSFSGDPQRAWQRRANPVLIALLHLILESRPVGRGGQLGEPDEIARMRAMQDAQPSDRLTIHDNLPK